MTRDAVYATDSVTGTVWRASLTGRAIGPLRVWLRADRFTPTAGFLNGIVTAPDQRALIVTDQLTDLAERSPRSGSSALRGGDFSADGLLLEGHSVSGVYNFSDPAEPSGAGFVTRLMRLSADFRTATWVADSQRAPGGGRDTPTTIARDGCRLLGTNSQLLTAAGGPPCTVTEVRDST